MVSGVGVLDEAALASVDGCEGLDPADRPEVCAVDLWNVEELLLALRLVFASVLSVCAVAAASLDGRERGLEEEEEEVLDVPPVFFGWDDLAEKKTNR